MWAPGLTDLLELGGGGNLIQPVGELSPLADPEVAGRDDVGRPRWNIRNISAVQRPMPLISVSSAIISSSGSCASASRSTLRRARARPDHGSKRPCPEESPASQGPGDRPRSPGQARRGPPNSSSMLPQIVAAALVESCCPTIGARASCRGRACFPAVLLRVGPAPPSSMPRAWDQTSSAPCRPWSTRGLRCERALGRATVRVAHRVLSSRDIAL